MNGKTGRIDTGTVGAREYRVAMSLLRDNFDRCLVTSAEWQDYSRGTRHAYLARAQHLATTSRRHP